MKKWVGFASCLLGVAIAMPSMAWTQALRSSLLVLSKDNQALAIIDPSTLHVLATVPVGGNPHEVIASADGRRAYVSNYGNGALDTITVVDLVARKRLTTIDLGPIYGPHGLTFVGGYPWFTAEREKLIGRLDPATNKVDWLLGVGQVGTHMLWVSRNMRHIVTVNVGSSTITLINRRPTEPLSAVLARHQWSKLGGETTRGVKGPLETDWDETNIAIGGNPEGFDVLHDAAGNPTTIWAARHDGGTIAIIDFATQKIVGTIDAGVPTAIRLRFTPDGRRALVSTESGHDLVVIDVASRKVIKRIPIGTGGGGIVIDPDGTRAFVSCSPDNYVAAIDLKTLSLIGKIDAGNQPDGTAWATLNGTGGGVSP